MKGTSVTTFSPSDSMTRAQFVTILGRYAGIKNSSADNPAAGTPYINAADKDALTTAIATINTNNDTAAKGSDAYATAITVLQNMEATQAEVDSALSALQ